MTEDFSRRVRRALKLEWSDPPDSVRETARARPSDGPWPAPAQGAMAQSMPAADVRASGTDETGLRQASFGSLDVSVLVQPPEGDGLWLVRGRIWNEESPDLEVHVALVQGENVLGTTTLVPGQRFEFRDLISDGWALEFRWGEQSALWRSESA